MLPAVALNLNNVFGILISIILSICFRITNKKAISAALLIFAAYLTIGIAKTQFDNLNLNLNNNLDNFNAGHLNNLDIVSNVQSL